MKKISIILIIISALTNSCSVNYSLSGKSISPEVQTFSVSHIANQSQQTVPTLSNDITEELKNKFRSQAGLQHVNQNGHLEFKGKIVTYDVSYLGVTASQEAAQNKLTISVEIEHTNNIDPTKNFKKRYTSTREFEASGGDSVEKSYIPEMIDEIITEIFMDSVANW
ncbi:MAG: LPS assembly lipoprotein LptE [Bacteroidales bacterium]